MIHKKRMRRIAVICAMTVSLILAGFCSHAEETVRSVEGVGRTKVESRMIGDIMYVQVQNAANCTGTAVFYDKNGAVLQTQEFELSDSYAECSAKAPKNYATAKFFVWNVNFPSKPAAEGKMLVSDRSVSPFTAPNVTSDMCSADFWTAKYAKAGNIVMTPEEIKQLNKDIIAVEDTNTYDISGEKSTFDGLALKRSIVADIDDIAKKANYIGGLPVPAEFFELIRTMLPADNGLSEKMEKRYGFCVNRTVMKSMPYTGFISDSPTDPEWDNWVLSAVAVNEPVAAFFTTNDGMYTYVQSSCCMGWVPTQDIAFCADKSEWESYLHPEHILVVTGEKIYLEASADLGLSEKMLTMGTVLPLVEENPGSVICRLPWDNYIVKIPARGADGRFFQRNALIPANRDVNVGYLPYTRENVLKQAFKVLGNRYGWGGMLNATDCSSYVREVYQCFGINLPRNTTWQAATPVLVVQLSGMTDEEKMAVLEQTPIGSIIQFPGHEMLYLGQENGLYYTINDVSSLVAPGRSEDGIVRPRSVIVNDLTTLRGNGTTWLSNVNRIIIVER